MHVHVYLFDGRIVLSAKFGPVGHLVCTVVSKSMLEQLDGGSDCVTETLIADCTLGQIMSRGQDTLSSIRRYTLQT